MVMPNTFSNAVSGLEVAAARAAASAANIARTNSRDAQGALAQPVRAEPVQVTSNGEGLGVRTETKTLTADYRIDLATELVESRMAEITYQANAQVIKAAKDMEEQLLDVLA